MPRNVVDDGAAEGLAKSEDHGVCGRNAANAALAARVTGWPRRGLGRAVIPRLTK